MAVQPRSSLQPRPAKPSCPARQPRGQRRMGWAQRVGGLARRAGSQPGGDSPPPPPGYFVTAEDFLGQRVAQACHDGRHAHHALRQECPLLVRTRPAPGPSAKVTLSGKRCQLRRLSDWALGLLVHVGARCTGRASDTHVISVLTDSPTGRRQRDIVLQSTRQTQRAWAERLGSRLIGFVIYSERLNLFPFYIIF